jgi:hypothetical protein
LRAVRGASCDLRVLVPVMSSSNNDVQWQRYVAVVGGALSRCCGCVQQHGALADGSAGAVYIPHHATPSIG